MADVTITLNIPAANYSRVEDAFVETFHWSPASGLTKKQFVKQQLIALAVNIVKKREYNARLRAVKAQVDAAAFSDPGIS